MRHEFIVSNTYLLSFRSIITRYCRDSVHIRELPHSPDTYSLGMDPLRFALGQELISIRALPSLLTSHLRSYDLESSSAEKSPTLIFSWNGFYPVPTMIPSCVVKTSLLQWSRMRESARAALRVEFGYYCDSFRNDLTMAPITQHGPELFPPQLLHEASQPTSSVLLDSVPAPDSGVFTVPDSLSAPSVSPEVLSVRSRQTDTPTTVVQAPLDEEIPEIRYLLAH